jgi:hypothetical protein
VRQRPLARVVCWLDELVTEEHPQPLPMRVQSQDVPRTSAWPLWVPHSNKRSPLRRTGPIRRRKAAREILPVR